MSSRKGDEGALVPAPWQRRWASGTTPSTGSASTLPMKDEEKEQVQKRPLGFVPLEVEDE